MIGLCTSLWQRVIPHVASAVRCPCTLEMGRVNTPDCLGGWTLATGGHRAPYTQPQSCQQPHHLPCMAAWDCAPPHPGEEEGKRGQDSVSGRTTRAAVLIPGKGASTEPRHGSGGCCPGPRERCWRPGPLGPVWVERSGGVVTRLQGRAIGAHPRTTRGG